MRSSHARHALSRSVASLARQRGRTIAAGVTLLFGSAVAGAVAVHDGSLDHNPVAQPPQPLAPEAENPAGPDRFDTPVVAIFGTPPVPGAPAAVPVLPASIPLPDDVGVTTATQSVPSAPAVTVAPTSAKPEQPHTGGPPPQVAPVPIQPAPPVEPPVEEPGGSGLDVVTEPVVLVLEPVSQPVAQDVEDTTQPAMSMLTPVITTS